MWWCAALGLNIWSGFPFGLQADLSQLKALRSFQMRVRLDDEIAAEAIREAARTRVSPFLISGALSMLNEVTL